MSERVSAKVKAEPMSMHQSVQAWRERSRSQRLAILLAVIVLTLASLGLRIAYFKNTSMVDPIRADAAQYVNYAVNLLNHGVFSMDTSSPGMPQPDSFRSPGYPLLIAAVFAVVDEESAFKVLLMLQAIMSSFLVPISFLLGMRFMPISANFIAASLVALSPHLVSSSSYLLTETTFAFVLSLAVWIFVESLEFSSAWLGSLAGVLFGVAYLVNEATLLLPVVLISAILGICFFEPSCDPPKVFRLRLWKWPLIAMVASFAVFPVAWSARNHLAEVEESLSGKQRAMNTLTHGTYPGFVFRDPVYKYYPYKEDPEQPEYADSIPDFLSIFGRRVKERPLRFLSWYLLEKPYYLWSWNILQGQGDIYIYPVVESLYSKSRFAKATRVVMKGLHPVLLLLILFGVTQIVRECRLRRCASILSVPTIPYVVLAYFTMIYSVFFPLPRYSIPLRPLLYLAGIWAIWTLILTLIRRRGPHELDPRLP